MSSLSMSTLVILVPGVVLPSFAVPTPLVVGFLRQRRLLWLAAGEDWAHNLLKDWRWLASKCVTEVKFVCGPRPLYTLVNGQAY